MRAAFLGFLATAALVSAVDTRCVNNDFEKLVSKISCGCPKRLSRCLAGIDIFRADQIQRCLISSGCELAESFTKADSFQHSCLAGPVEWGVKDALAVENVGVEVELKKRQLDFGNGEGSSTADDSQDATSTADNKGGKHTKSADSADSSTEDAPETTEKPKTTPAKTTKEDKTTSAPSTADATTTSDHPTSSPDSTNANTPSSTTSDHKTTVTPASATTEGTILQCMVTNVITTSECSFSRGKKVDCHPTLNTAISCAPGLICQTDSKTGADVCLKRHSKLTTSGITVTILLVTGLLIATIALVISNYQSKASARRRELEHAAYIGGGAYGKGGKGPSVAVQPAQPYNQPNPSEDHVPLMAPGGPRMDQQNYQQQYQQQYYSQDYFDGSRGGSNSVSPSEQARAPKLHPGLGALGQDYR